jgi:hypothetical protein
MDEQIVIDPWAKSFDEVKSILSPLGIGDNKISDPIWIKNHISEYRDLIRPDVYDEVLILLKHIHS